VQNLTGGEKKSYNSNIILQKIFERYL